MGGFRLKKKKKLKCFVLSFQQVIFSKYTDLLPKDVLHDDAPELQRPDGEAVQEVSETLRRYLRSEMPSGHYPAKKISECRTAPAVERCSLMICCFVEVALDELL